MIFAAPLRGREYSHPRFTGEESEGGKRQVTCPDIRAQWDGSRCRLQARAVNPEALLLPGLDAAELLLGWELGRLA